MPIFCLRQRLVSALCRQFPRLGDRLDAAPIRDYTDLLQILRQRQAELSVSCLTIDEISGLANGHSSKLLAGLKRCGILSYFLLARALALRIVVVPDDEALERLRHRLVKRNEAHVRTRPRVAQDASDHPAAV